MTLAEDIVQRVDHAFGERADRARSRLERLAAEVDGANARILRCVVQLAEGDVDKLEHFAACAKADWRDLIHWAEYDLQDHRIRDLNEPFGETAEPG